MLSAMTWQQLVEWSWYDQLDPFGEMRADLRMGSLASTIVNTAAAQAGGRGGSVPSDFMPKFDKVATTTGARQPLTETSDWSALTGRLKDEFAAVEVSDTKESVDG